MLAEARLVDRTPPYAAEAEVSVLGAMLISQDAVVRVVELLRPEDFYVEAHRIVFRTMMALFQKGVPCEAVTVGEALQDAGRLEDLGGWAFLTELMDAVPTAANVEYHAGIVLDRAKRRRLIEAGTSIVRDAYEPDGRDTESLIDTAQRRLYEVADDRGQGEMEWIKKILYPTFQRIEQLQESKGGITGISTGLADLDGMTGGLHAGDLVLCAARPSMGKTALVTGIALHSAISSQIPTGIFSLEMTKEQIVQRMLCYESLVDLGRLLRGQLIDDDYVRLAQAAGHLNTAPLFIDDRSGLRVLDVRSKARRLKAENPDLKLIIVDYIQLMAGEGENRQQQVSEISRGLKGIAKELGVCVLALSQLSRNPEARQDKRPQLSDLRESGSLEQDADLVMFLYRPEYYLSPTEAQDRGLVGKTELIIGKQRNGPTGSIELFFRKESARFESYTNWGMRT